jgi:hypothetical protein
VLSEDLPCIRCGAPGSTRHAPDGPYSAEWCDRCFRLRQYRAAAIALALVAVLVGIAMLNFWTAR